MKRNVVAFILSVCVLILLAVPAAAQDTAWTLTETLEISNSSFGFRIAYPAGWTTDRHQQVTVINELAADQQHAFDGTFVTQGYSIRFESISLRQMRQLGLQPANATPEEFFQVNSQRYSYQQPVETADLTFLARPALRAQTVDGAGNAVSTVQGVIDGAGYMLTLAAPSPEALDAFLPTWEQMLDSIEYFKGTVNVGDYSLPFECQGEGSPTVILEIGWGGKATDWLTALPHVREFTRVCAVNRRHELGDGAIEQHTADLHRVLVDIRSEGPYVLVGHSYGGLVIRVFADEYPDEVVGMVFVDSAHEDQEARLAEVLSQKALDELGLSPDFETSLARVAETGSLGDMPVVVLTAEKDGALPGNGISQDTVDQLDQIFQPIWINELQVELAQLSTRGRQIIVPGTNHVSIASNAAVTDAIREVVDEVRAQSVCTRCWPSRVVLSSGASGM